jgi:ubiquinone biosynthesis O-methyltransferase
MPTISLCMIVRDVDDSLDECLASVEKYVDEIVVVDTGSKDKTKEVALAHGAKIFDFNPETNPSSFILDDEATGAPGPFTGELILADFSGARNLSFDKATKDFVFWIDSDDVVEGAENLPKVLSELEKLGNGVAWFRYDYSYENGKPNCQLWRERIMPRGLARWVNPIHEICQIPNDAKVIQTDLVSISHRRQHLAREKPIRHRNYKVLRREYEQTKDRPDPRTLFYLGNESKFHAPAEAIAYFEHYLRLSGWNEERAVARILLGQLHEHGGDLEAAFKSYSSAAIDLPTNPDSFFALARLAFKKQDWASCIRLTEQGLALGNPTSPIMANPLDRTYHPYTYYNVALNSVGRVVEASKACEEGLKVIPTDANLKYNKDLYDRFLTTHPQIRTPVVASCAIDLSVDPFSNRPELPVQVTSSMVIHVWKEMLRHDEIVKARDYLNALPYFLDEDPAVLRAKAKTDELLEKVSTNKAVKEFYATHEANEAIALLSDVPKRWSQWPRWNLISKFIENKPRLRILDLGCQDGWVSNRLALKGHSVVGVDFSDAHLAIARRHATNLNLDATYLTLFINEALERIHEKFDVVICSEVIEHVVAPSYLILSLHELLKDDGHLLLSTPKGAWLRGAHDVKFGDTKAPAWDEPREHIRAYSRVGLKQELEVYFDVQSCYEAPMPSPDVEGQGTILAVATRSSNKLPSPPTAKIVIWAGPAWEWWNPNSPYEEGTGGSELACIEMAKQFVNLGCEVLVYSDCPNMEGLYEGVEYRHFGSAKSIDCDYFISSRQPHVVVNIPIKAKAKFLWVHDIHVGSMNAAMHSALLEFDRILCLSNWHKEFFCQMYPWLDRNRVLVTRNGIHLERFPYPERSRDNRLIWTSSANRGLDKLLDLFPRIRQLVPDVELDVFYGFNVWRRAAAGNTAELSEIDRIEAKLVATEGVHARGRANQQTLAKAWLGAKVWAYPTQFTETSCISAMEAQASGCVPVTTRLAALGETVQAGVLLAPDMPDYDEWFIASVVELLTNEEQRLAQVRKGRKHAETLSWRALACQWMGMLQETAKDVLVNPMHRFSL